MLGAPVAVGLLLGLMDGAPEVDGLSDGIGDGQSVVDGDSLGWLLGFEDARVEGPEDG